MRASTYKQLGQLAGVLLAISKAYENDPISRHYGLGVIDYTPVLSAAARAEGFASLEHLYAEIERRTSPRWVYFNMPRFTPTKKTYPRLRGVGNRAYAAGYSYACGYHD